MLTQVSPVQQSPSTVHGEPASPHHDINCVPARADEALIANTTGARYTPLTAAPRRNARRDGCRSSLPVGAPTTAFGSCVSFISSDTHPTPPPDDTRSVTSPAGEINTGCTARTWDCLHPRIETPDSTGPPRMGLQSSHTGSKGCRPCCWPAPRFPGRGPPRPARHTPVSGLSPRETPAAMKEPIRAVAPVSMSPPVSSPLPPLISPSWFVTHVQATAAE